MLRARFLFDPALSGLRMTPWNDSPGYQLIVSSAGVILLDPFAVLSSVVSVQETGVPSCPRSSQLKASLRLVSAGSSWWEARSWLGPLSFSKAVADWAVVTARIPLPLLFFSGPPPYMAGEDEEEIGISLWPPPPRSQIKVRSITRSPL